MKFSDLLSNWLMNTELFEQAYRKRELENRISAQQINIANHMIKIMIFPESINQHHWRKEIDSWIRPMNRYKLKNGNHLNHDKIRELIFDQPLGTLVEVEFYVNDIIEEYPNENVVKFDLVELQKTLANIMNNVSKDVSSRCFKKIENYL